MQLIDARDRKVNKIPEFTIHKENSYVNQAIQSNVIGADIGVQGTIKEQHVKVGANNSLPYKIILTSVVWKYPDILHYSDLKVALHGKHISPGAMPVFSHKARANH